MAANSDLLGGKTFVVTAGGTREYLDPVRFITNASSGKLALEVAEAIIARGGQVVLVETGIDVPAGLAGKLAGRHTAYTAFDMLTVLTKLMPDADGLVMLAAVADYSPAAYSTTKRKKDGGTWSVEFSETPDILATMSASRKPGQLFAGVALEDTDWLSRAVNKLHKKSVDVLLAVELGPNLPFGDNTMNCALVAHSGVVAEASLRPKPVAASMLADWFCDWFK